MSSRSIPFFDASQLLFNVFSSPALTKCTNRPRKNNKHILVGVGGVEGVCSLGALSSRGCVSNRHSLHFLRGRVLFDYLDITYLEVEL